MSVANVTLRVRKHTDGVAEPTSSVFIHIPSNMASSNKRIRETEPLPEDFILIGKDIQNKSGRSGAPLTEVRAFRKFFGMTAVIMAKLWSFLLQRDMIPEQGRTNHLMWALFFMRAYPKEVVPYPSKLRYTPTTMGAQTPR